MKLRQAAQSLLIILTIILFTSGCTLGEFALPTKLLTPETGYPPPISGPGYPAPTIYSPYPFTQATNPLPTLGPTLPPPTKAANTGIVEGTLLHYNEPVVNAILYLAGLIKDAQGQDVFASLDRINSPKSLTDDKGNFIFYNIPPGKYGLVLDTVQDSYLLHYPETPQQIIIEVTADSRVSLGELNFQYLPIP